MLSACRVVATLAKYSSCMHKVSLWCVRVTIIATETQKFLLYYFWPTCKCQQFTNRRALPWKCNNGFHLHCCRATKYFVMLSTIRTYWGLHAKCLMFLSDFNQIWSPSADFRKYPPNIKYQISRKMVERKTRWYTRIDKDGRTDMKKLLRAIPYLYKSTCMYKWIYVCMYTFWGTLWRSWLRHCATSRKVVGSIPDGVIGIFHWHNPSGRNMVLGLTLPPTEMSTRNISWG